MENTSGKKRDPTLGDGSDTTIATPTKEQLLLHLETIFPCPTLHEAVIKFGRNLASHLEDLDDPRRLARRIIDYLKTQYPDDQKFSVIRYEIEMFLPKIVKRLFINDAKSYKMTIEMIVKGFKNQYQMPNGKHKIKGSL